MRVDRTGVGRYDPSLGPIQAEDYFGAEACEKLELPLGGFGVRGAKTAWLHYPHIHHLDQQKSLTIAYLGLGSDTEESEIEIVFSRADAPQAKLAVRLPAVPRHRPASVPVELALPAGVDAMTIRFGLHAESVALDALAFSPRPVRELSPPALFAG